MPRYIDADALRKIKFHPLPYQYVVPSDVDKESYVRGWNDVIDGIIETMPTADVAEVKHGKWIWQGSIFEGCWVCSECNHSFYQGYGNENFCPNCGADMRGEDNAHDL